MKVAITARLRNGPLWEAAQKLGGMKALAEYLDIPYATVVAWVNFTVVPDPEKKSKYDYAAVEMKMAQLTGALLDDIFPKELRGKRNDPSYRAKMKRLSTRQTIYQEIPVSQLLPGQEPKALSAAIERIEENLDYDSLKTKLSEVMDTLTPREKQVLTLHYGLDGEGKKTLDKIAEIIKVSRERVRQILAAALRHMRAPGRSNQLTPYIDIPCNHATMEDSPYCKRCGLLLVSEIIDIEAESSIEDAVKARQEREHE